MKRVFPLTVQRHSARNRGGAFIIIAMVALLLASAICAAVLKTALTEQRLVVREQIRMQSNWFRFWL